MYELKINKNRSVNKKDEKRVKVSFLVFYGGVKRKHGDTGRNCPQLH